MKHNLLSGTGNGVFSHQLGDKMFQLNGSLGIIRLLLAIDEALSISRLTSV